MSTFAANLKFVRKHYRWSQGQLSIKLGVTITRISNWENGTAVPRLPDLLKLSKVLRIPDLEAFLSDPEYHSKFPALSK